MRTRQAVAGLGAVLCVAVSVLLAASPYADDTGDLFYLAPPTAAAFIATGVWAWARQPGNRTGVLMVVCGFTWLGNGLAGVAPDGLAMVGWILFSLPFAVVIHLVLGFPSGRLGSRRLRALVAVGYVAAALPQLPGVLFYDPSTDCACWANRDNPFLVSRNPDLFNALTAVQTLVALGALIVAAAIIVRRYRTAAPGDRHALQPVLGAGVAIVLDLVLTLLADLTDFSDDAENFIDAIGRLAVLSIPVLFLAGLARSRFADLTVENARLQAARIEELRASRARIVRATDEERRRLERDLHDGAQQRLVSLALTLRLARTRADGELAELLDDAATQLQQATEELRELARGIHPAVLTDQGLGAAVRSLAARSPVPIRIDAIPAERLPAPVESAAYFVVAEALTNVARYAQAGTAAVSVARENGHLTVEVSDDGVGGADPATGTGLRGLEDRVAALDGTLEVTSSPDAGTTVRACLPCAS